MTEIHNNIMLTISGLKLVHLMTQLDNDCYFTVYACRYDQVHEERRLSVFRDISSKVSNEQYAIFVHVYNVLSSARNLDLSMDDEDRNDSYVYVCSMDLSYNHATSLCKTTTILSRLSLIDMLIECRLWTIEGVV